MKPTLFLIWIFLSFPVMAFDHNHSPWTEVLKQYQNSQGMVNYKALKSDSNAKKEHKFNQYLSEIQKVTFKDYSSWTKEQKMAYLINAYNALTLKLIIQNYPVKSIKKIGGFFTKAWDVEFFSLLDGKIKSLDPIEHKWLRPQFKDYRIHAAVNCASISCPALRNEAFVPQKLSQQLDEQMKLWLNDKSRNQIDFQKNIYKLSKIFDWYKKDFVDWGGGVLNVAQKYTEAKKELKEDIEYLDYDWNLNEFK